jgi:hypothetical protein
MFNKTAKNTTTDENTSKEVVIPVSQVRTVLRQIVQDGQFLRNEKGGWLFTEKAPFTGLNLHASYASEEQAIDTLVEVYFPEARRIAAA